MIDNILLPSGYGLGIDAFILSGYPHAQECELFSRHVLNRMEHAPLERHPVAAAR